MLKRSHELQTESDILLIYWLTEHFDEQRNICTLHSFLYEAETLTVINTSEFPYAF